MYRYSNHQGKRLLTQEKNYDKKSPANAKGNVQQRWMLESPVTQNQLHRVPDKWWLIIWCFTRTHQRVWPVSLCQRHIGWKSQFSLSPLI